MLGQDLLRLIRIIGRWWWVSALVLLATVGVLLAIIAVAEPRYQAAVTIQVSAPPPQEAPLFSEYGREVVSQQIEQTRLTIAEFVQAGNVVARVLERLPEVQMSERALREQTEVELPTASQTIIVRVEAPNAATAALLANTVAEVSLEYYAQIIAQPTAHNRGFIEQQLQVAGERLSEAEAKLEQFRLEHTVYNVEKAIDEQVRLLSVLRQNGDLARAQNKPAEFQQMAVVIAERENELQALIQLVPEHNMLVDQVAHARSTNNLLLERLNEAQIKESQILSNSSLHIIRSARPPAQPLPAVSNAILFLSVVSSLLAGVLLAMVMEYLENLMLARRRAHSLPPDVVISPVSRMQ